jgi:quercetin dioxygenase-like cupin family protein
MRNRTRRLLGYGFVFLLVLSFAATSQGQGPHPAGQNIAEMQFGQIPGLPTCATASVQSGDPTKGPSILLAKMEAGCVFPLHWHTPNENLMMVTGEGRVEMKDEKPVTLRAGGFAQMPSRHAHQFGCAKACMLYVFSDAAFDMHYLDGEGKEISPDEALKKVGETAAKAPK